MNKKLFAFVFASVVIFAACSPKSTTKAAAAKIPSTEPTEVQLTAVKTKYPDATLDVLKKGHSIYYGACTRCHGAKDINRRDETAWVGILDDMAPKARLTAEEKDATWKYIMSVKLSQVK